MFLSLLLGVPPSVSEPAQTPLEISIARLSPKNVEFKIGSHVYFRSPDEGLWSIATDWHDGWPSRWVHGVPERTEVVGDWTMVEGVVKTPNGNMEVRDAYRVESGILHGVRRWTWKGKAVLPRCTLSIRWLVPGARMAKPMLPGVVLYGNPAGEKTGNHAVIVHKGNPGDRTYVEEHRLSAPWESIEWKDGEVFRAAAMHTTPSPAFAGNQNDQWWTLGLTSEANWTELACLSGPIAANGQSSVTKALQEKFLEYPDTWLNLKPGTTIEKSFFLEATPETVKGSGFRLPLRNAMKLHPSEGLDEFPKMSEIIRGKVQFAKSRYRTRGESTGFEMYPPFVKGTHYVMGWAGQADGGAYGLLGLAKRCGDPKMAEMGQRALDWLTHAPFNTDGFMVSYEADKGTWQDQDPVSQGQAMEVFARAIQLGHKLKGVVTNQWEHFLQRACEVQATRILRSDWKPINTAEAFFVSPLCKGYELFHDHRFREAAEKMGDYYAKRHLSMDEPYWGGTLDANCEDKEGAWAAFQAFLALYELSKEKKYLDFTSHALDVVLTYTVLWNIDLPAGRLRDHNLKTRGWTVVSAQNQHLDVFGVVFTPEIWRMGNYLRRPELKILAAEMYRRCGQMMDPFGSTGEQIQHTNFAQQGDMSNVFHLRGGYSEGWTVFWITAHFLNAATEFERMGVDLDRLDHLR